MTIPISFRLRFGTRHDPEANVYVGYCPSLRLYSQGRSEEEADKAIFSAAQLFLVACYERDILHSVLRERGMTGASMETIKNIPEEALEYIAVFPRRYELDVPITLVAEREAAVACHQR